MGVSNITLRENTYGRATLNLQSHQLLVDLHFTKDKLIARLDCVDEVILISRNSTNGFTSAFRGVSRVIFTKRVDAVALTLYDTSKWFLPPQTMQVFPHAGHSSFFMR